MDPLYHYCSSATFSSIISRKTIWLSSLSLSNDTMEGRLVTKTFDRLLSQLTVDPEDAEIIRMSFQASEDMCEGLGFCLSEKPDLLSQWRGYADDGQGFSIGFNVEYLQQLQKSRADGETGFVIKKVLYEPHEHEAVLIQVFERIKTLIESGALKAPRWGLLSSENEEEKKQRIDEHHETLKALWMHTAGTTFTEGHRLKSKAFSEEAEWRLVSLLLKDEDDPALFRAAGNRLVPYREFSLKPLVATPIAEVYLGPKNITPEIFIKKFLRSWGFIDVDVRRSAATYR